MIDPVAFSLFGVDIRWYGLSYVFGFILSWRYAILLSHRHTLSLTRPLLDNFLTWTALGVIIGGRVGNCLFYNFWHIMIHPIEILLIRKGGMFFHGGTIGVSIALLLFCRKYKVKLFALSDLVATVVPIGLFLGRLANFINQEVYGKPTTLPVGVVFERIDLLPRHPSQLYEAFLEGAVILVVLGLLFKTLHKTPGLLSALFLILYGVFRFLVEYVREPDGIVSLLGHDIMSYGLALSLPMVVAGLFLFYLKNRRT